jgi:hypothetical protein
MDAPGMDGKMDAPGMDAPATPKPDAARVQAQVVFMKARRLGEEAEKLRSQGAAADRTKLATLRSRFDQLDRQWRGVKTADAATKQLLAKARTRLDAADKLLIDVRLSLDLERSKRQAKKTPPSAEDF